MMKLRTRPSYLFDRNKAYNYFRSTFTCDERSSNGWHYFDNPFDPEGSGKRKMHVNFDTAWVKCWRTGYSASLVHFVREYERLRKVSDSIDIINNQVEKERLPTSSVEVAHSKHPEQKGVVPPAGFRLLDEGSDNWAVVARNYIESRGLKVDTLAAQTIGYVPGGYTYSGRIVLPFTRAGGWLYYTCRDFLGRKDQPRYKLPKAEELGRDHIPFLLYNEDALYLYEEVYVVEGIFDALTLGPQAVALAGSQWGKKGAQRFLESSARTIIFIADKGMYKTWLKAALHFIDDKQVKVVSLEDSPYEDVNAAGFDYISRKIEITPYLTDSFLLENYL